MARYYIDPRNGTKLRINEGHYEAHPMNCPVIEQTADGVAVGVCCYHLDSGVCPRHGKIEVIDDA